MVYRRPGGLGGAVCVGRFSRVGGSGVGISERVGPGVGGVVVCWAGLTGGWGRGRGGGLGRARRVGPAPVGGVVCTAVRLVFVGAGLSAHGSG